MAVFKAESTDRGHWINIFANESANYATLSAHQPDTIETTPLTLYWRGRTDATTIIDFFDQVATKNPTSLLAALIFTPFDKFRLDKLVNTQELKSKLPTDISFLRLECRSRAQPRAPYEADFIVWARVDLEAITRGDPAPDNIGVWLDPARLTALHTQIATFIASTHIVPDVGQPAVSDALHTLANNLGN